MTDVVIAAPRRLETAGRTRPYTWLCLAAGLVASLVAVAGASSPSLSSDETATFSAAGRTWEGLWELAQHVDGHFLPYYSFMHLWQELGDAGFGNTVWWLRLPSVVATGVAAALIAALGHRLHSVQAGLFAATCYAILPSVSYHGQNMRPYAFAAAAAVFSVWALHRALDESSRRSSWAVYAVAVAVLGCTHLFALLILPAHLVVARGSLKRVLPCLAVGLLPGTALAAIGFGERHAISWIQLPKPKVFLALPRMVGGTDLSGWVLFAMAATGAVLLLRTGRPPRRWTGLQAAWALLPPVLLFALSHLLTPVYVDRYLFATTPAFALLAGLGLAAVPRLLGVVLLAGALVAGLPGQLDFRGEDGHWESYPAVVRAVNRGARPGDAILFVQTWLRTGVSFYTRPLSGRGTWPDDMLLRNAAPVPGRFDFPERTDVAAALDGRDRVWIVWRGTAEAGTRYEKVRSVVKAGFRRAKVWRSPQLPGITTALYTRTPAPPAHGRALH